MLRLYDREQYIDELDQSNIVRDAEIGFKYIQNTINTTDNDIIRYIDKAYIDNSGKLIDRFGYKIRLGDLSTGCKAALLVRHMPNMVIDTIECGNNAKKAIIVFCKNGNAIITPLEEFVQFEESFAVDVWYKGIHFKSLDEINDFIEEGE